MAGHQAPVPQQPIDPVTSSRVAAYVRLSREDLTAPGATADKFARLRGICLSLAAQHGLELREQDIIQERESGTTLAKRPGMSRILDSCRAGAISHLVTPYQDRLTRGDLTDQAALLSALTAGGVTLITTEGAQAFAELRASDELLYGVKAAVARWYVRDVSEKRVAHNREKIRRNQRTSGRAPYGYRKVVPHRDAYGAIIPPSDADHDAGRAAAGAWLPYVPDPDTYQVAAEVLRRVLRADSLRGIAADLNARGIKAPAGVEWRPSGIRAVASNPVYCGYHARAYTTAGGAHSRHMEPEDYILADQPGPWLTPLRADDWPRMVHALGKSRDRTRSARTGLVSGILHCSEGHPMVLSSGADYTCQTGQTGVCHPGCSIAARRANAWARATVEAVLRALPADALTSPAEDDARLLQLRREHPHLRRQVTALQEEVDNIVRQTAALSRRIDPADLDRAYQAVRAELDAARQRLREADAEVARPHVSEVAPLLVEVLDLGVEAFWSDAPIAHQRRLVRAVIARLDLLPSQPRAKRRAGTATLHDWCAGVRFDPPPIPPPRQTEASAARWHQVRDAHDQGVSVAEIARLFGLSASSVYRIVRRTP
jgi:DNA invertase Pin-like site-specific DNA recombinase